MKNSEKKEDLTPIQAIATRPEDINWIEFQLKEKQDTLKRLEETARYLSGLSSISLSIMVGPGNEVFKQLTQTALLKTGITCWLVSILFTLAVLFPFRYRYVENSAASIKNMNRKTVTIKFTLLMLGTLFYLAGICITVYLYLFR